MADGPYLSEYSRINLYQQRDKEALDYGTGFLLFNPPNLVETGLTVSYKNLNPKACCYKGPLSLSFASLDFPLLFLATVFRTVYSEAFFFNLTNGFFHYSQHFNDRTKNEREEG